VSSSDFGNPVKKDGDSRYASCAERLRESSQSNNTVQKCLDLKINKSVSSLYKANAHYLIRRRYHLTIHTQSCNITTQKYRNTSLSYDLQNIDNSNTGGSEGLSSPS
jgi:hypothetical protein